MLCFSLDVECDLKYICTLLKITNSTGIVICPCQESLGLGLNENKVWTVRAVTKRNSYQILKGSGVCGWMAQCLLSMCDAHNSIPHTS